MTLAAKRLLDGKVECSLMGAWGHRNFQNDDALDWIAELVVSDDAMLLGETLAAVIDSDGGYIEAPEASMALAAAEIVATLLGRPPSDLPEEAAKWAAGKPTPRPELIELAQRAVQQVLEESELKGLWADEPEYWGDWLTEVEGLSQRLAETPPDLRFG